jgi:transcriptional regulator with XRE-family HTH domain
MSEADFEKLFSLIERAMAVVPLNRRELEDALGVGHGTIYRLLDGRLELKVRHLLELARVLDVPPGDFLTLGCPQATESASFTLAERLTPVKGKRAPGAAALVEELRPALRQMIQEELAAATATSSGKRR